VKSPREGNQMHTRSRIARLMAAGAAVLGLVAVGFAGAVPAYAADMAVSISPADTTTESGVATTYTLTYSCSNAAGSCASSVVTIPTNNVINNGANTDFSSWVSTTTCPAVNKAVAGQVSFALGTLATGTYTCTFRVLPPEYTTLNNATATITPTLSSSNSTSSTAAPATLTATAGHNNSLIGGAAAQAITGAPTTLTISYICGLNRQYTGDVGVSAVTISVTLPANFEYQSFAYGTSLPGTSSYDPATRVFTYSDPTGKTCGNPPLNISNQAQITLTGTATTNGVPDAVGSKICFTPSAGWTYLDGVAGSATAAQSCSTVIDVNTTVSKSVTPSNFANYGQYKAPDGTTNPYTYVGNWDGSGAPTYFDLNVANTAGAKNSGIAYEVEEPLPCLTNVSNGTYSSNAVGTHCTSPAYIPTLITPFNFPVTVADAITLVYSDGTTGSVPYTAGKGWVIPTSPAVAEIDIPPFTSEGSNTSSVLTFRMFGYSAPIVPTTSVLKNTVSSTPVDATTKNPFGAAQTASRTLTVVAPPADGGALVQPGVFAAQVGTTCAANVAFQNPSGSVAARVEIPSAPSQAIYVDYLAPLGTTTVNAPTTTFQLTSLNGNGGKSFTSTAVTPTLTADYNGTGRTLVRYTVPAGAATTAGWFTLRPTSGITLVLEAGCAGTYQNDITIGYGAPVTRCIFGAATTPPLNPADPDLRANGAPTAGNYCGYSFPLKIDPIKPGFTVDKTVQGNLDPAAIGSGGTGHVSVDGGTATYTVSFLNSGSSTLNDPVMYDLLPRVGDTRASSTATRDSKFPVALTGVGALPAGLTIAYSQTSNPCRPEVLFSNPGCVDDWSATAPSPLSKVTAVKFIYSGRITVNTGFSATYTVSTPPAAAGLTAWNSVGTNATAGDALVGTTGGSESSLTGLQAQSAQPAITKTADRTTVDAVGRPIVYTFTVTNNTAVALGNVRVGDALVDSAPSSIAPTATCAALTSPAAPCSGAVTSLAPGQSATFTATYVTSQADLDFGRISDQATATADPPTGPSLSNSSGVVTVTAVQSGALSLTKSANPGTVDAVGDTVDYTFHVTNTGNVTLRTVDIAEGTFSGTGALSAISCPPDALAPGASVDCTASYPVTQADLTAGSVVNVAAATAIDPSGATITSPESTATVTVDQVAGLAIVKSANPSAAAAYNAGQLITYTYVVSNTGNIPVAGIVVNERTFTGTGALSAISCPATQLDPASQFSCTATYTLTQEDVDSGSLTNTANATGIATTGPVTAGDSTVTTPQDPVSKLTLTKTASTAYVNAAGDTITYTFAIRNTGNVTVHDVTAEETAFSGAGSEPAITCPSATLAPGQEVDCTATYTVTQADMDAGNVVNTARATGMDPTDAAVISTLSTATVTVNTAPSLALVKSADASSFNAVGTTMTFSFLVTNTGNVALTHLALEEGTFTGTGALGDIDCPAGDLAPGESTTCTAGYDTTQADLDRGAIVNTATAVATTGSGASVVSDPSTVTIPAVQAPALVLEKTVTPTTADAAGDAVTYSFHVSNTGNVTLTGLAIVESAFSGTGAIAVPDCGTKPLKPGVDVTCTVTYQVTQADVDAGTVTNTAIASGAIGATAVQSNASTATVSIDREPALSLVKSASPAAPAEFKAGQTITYSFVVTNTGNVTITDPGVQEDTFTGTGTLAAPTCPTTASLAPGEQVVCSTEYTVTQADIDAGSVTNSATADGTGPAGATPLTPAASTVTVPEPAKPSLALLKTTDVTKVTAAGQLVTYTFAVTNTGNTTASGIGIEEGAFTGHGTAPTVDCPAGDLLPGQKLTCTADYTVVAADLNGQALSNTATAAAHTPGGATVASDPSSARIEDVIADPTDAGDVLAHTGSTIAWGVGLAAFGSMVVGAFLAVTRRRRRPQR
jgi:uncharacterized repeat protein (TIGR01451 family)